MDPSELFLPLLLPFTLTFHFSRRNIFVTRSFDYDSSLSRGHPSDGLAMKENALTRLVSGVFVEEKSFVKLTDPAPLA